MIDHQPEFIAQYADSVVLMSEGKTLWKLPVARAPAPDVAHAAVEVRELPDGSGRRIVSDTIYAYGTGEAFGICFRDCGNGWRVAGRNILSAADGGTGDELRLDTFGEVETHLGPTASGSAVETVESDDLTVGPSWLPGQSPRSRSS